MIFDTIRGILGNDGVIDAKEQMEPYLTSWRGGWEGKTPFVALPANTKQLAEVVKLCHQAHVGIVPQGGNTGLVGGATPSSDGDELLINLSRMNQIRSVNPLNYTLIAEAGCTMQQVQEAATKEDRLFSISMSSEGSAQVGGFVSTNAGGTAVLRYGTTRELVLGVEAVLPSGNVLHDLHTLRKDNTGYDMKQLLIGGEGTLGIITAAAFTLYPTPKQQETAFLGIRHLDDAIRLLSLFREQTGDCLSACELISHQALSLVLDYIPDTRAPLENEYPYYLLVEASLTYEGNDLRSRFEQALEKAFAKEFVVDGVIAESLSQQEDFWKLRHSISEAELHHGRGVHFDVSVPITKVPDFIDVADKVVKHHFEDATIVSFGHIGDGNIHYNICFPKHLKEKLFQEKKAKLKQLIYKDLREHSGSISAEHGIGQDRKEDLYDVKSHVEFEMMQKVKKALDPYKIMNPNKML